MITTEQARNLSIVFSDIDDAIFCANKAHQDTQLGYWGQVVRILQLKKTHPNYQI